MFARKLDSAKKKIKANQNRNAKISKFQLENIAHL